MHQDDIIIYISSILLLILIIASLKTSKIFGIINSCVFVIYTGIFLNGLYNYSQGGRGLVWWFYLLVLTWIHLLIVGLYLIIKKRKKQHTTQG